MNVEVNRKDSIWSLIGIIVSMGSNLIILPFLLYYLDEDSVGLYYVFMSLYAFNTLVDFGFTPSFARSMAYAWSGASHLQKSGVAASNSAEPNWQLMKKLVVSCRYIYISLASVTLFLGLTIGNIYIKHITHSFVGNTHLVAWNIFVIAMFLTLLYGYYSAFLRGVGAIAKVNMATTTARIVQIILCIVLLFFGYGLIGISIAYLVYGFVFRFLAKNSFYKYKNIGLKLKGFTTKISFEEVKETVATLWPNTWREGLITLSNYLLNQATVLVASFFLSLSETGIYSLSVQLVSAVSIVAGILYTSYQTALQSSYANRNQQKTKEIVAIILSSSTYFFILGIIMLIFIGSPLIKFIKPTYVMPPTVILLLALYHYFLRYRDCFCSYFAATNRLIYTKAFIISAVLCIILSIFSTAVLQTGMYGLIVSQIISQLIFNVWYWAKLACNELNLNAKFIFIEGPKLAFKDFAHNK